MDKEEQLNELFPLKEILRELREKGKVLVAVLYGSYAKGTPHRRSDIDLAIYIRAEERKEEIEILDRILMATERKVSILRLDDEEESPFVVREALKGIHIVEPEREALYEISHRILHECEEIRFRRELSLE